MKLYILVGIIIIISIYLFFIRKNIKENLDTRTSWLEKTLKVSKARNENPTTVPPKEVLNGHSEWLNYNRKDHRDEGGEYKLSTTTIQQPPKSHENVDALKDKCATLSKCEDIDNSKTALGGCGFCHTKTNGNTFRGYLYWLTSIGENKPGAAVCKPSDWSTTTSECIKKEEQAICNKITSCGDMIGEAGEKCGWCPTVGKAFVKQKNTTTNKWEPKYSSEDKCDGMGGYGLLTTPEECMKFGEDHPCLTPKYKIGQHSKDCYKDQWAKSGCKKEIIPGGGEKWDNYINNNASSHQYKPYSFIGNLFKDIYNKATGTGTSKMDYYQTKGDYKNCYGKDPDPCDDRYTFNKDCMNRQFVDAGCKPKGELYPGKLNDSSINSIKNKTKSVYKSEIVDLYKEGTRDLAGLGTTEFKKVEKAMMQCFGEKPPPPPPLNVGDTVKTTLRLTKKIDNNCFSKGSQVEMKGVVCGDLGDSANVMWTHIKPLSSGCSEISRTTLDKKKQKIYTGWCGVSPEMLFDKSSSTPHSISKRKLTIMERCPVNRSACKPSCREIVRDLYERYPAPQNCIVNPWTSWSTCKNQSKPSKNCGPGLSFRSRTIKYNNSNEGEPCPILGQQRSCLVNNRECINGNFNQINK